MLSLQQISKIISPVFTTVNESSTESSALEVSTDSRNLRPGDVFVALKGERFNGHDFLNKAVEKGAIALIVEEPVPVNLLKQIPCFQVQSTLEAYQKIAAYWRSQWAIPVIAVTGSVGKTTTKELIAAVLSSNGVVLKSEANHNNEIGVPQTLLQLSAEHDYAVIEMGMRAKGEIAQLTQITYPTIAVITNVGTAHIGRLGSEEAIAQAKCELLAEMPSSSIAILNHDNQLLRETASKIWRGQTVTYGFNGGDITGKLINSTTMRVENLDLPLPLKGRHHALNYLAAYSVAKVLGIKLEPLVKGLSVSLPRGRAKSYHLPNDIVILDESYNAGLESMLAALDLLKETPGTRQIAVLGTMKELGEYSSKFHRKVGEKIKELGIDYLLVLIDDPETEEIAKGASGVKTECFTERQELVKRLKALVSPGDRLLFKASNSVGLNLVIEQFLSD